MAAINGHRAVENGKKSEDYNEKKERMIEKIQRRQEDRVADLKKRQEERQDRSSKSESVQFFISTFANEKSAIESRVKTVDGNGKTKPELISIFDGITLSVQKLQKYVTDSALFLTAHDLGRAQEEVTKLYVVVNDKREELIPKKKFAFKARKKETQQPNNNSKISGKIGASVKPSAPGKENRKEDDVVDVDGVIVNSTSRNGDLSLFSQFQCGIFNKTDEEIKLNGSEINGKDVGLTNLTSCTVQLYGTPSAIHMDRITNCTIFCGPVPGSVFVDNCKDSTLVLSCQQLRVHHTKDTKFYLHVTSRGIIEDTNKVQFAPYNWTYAEIENDYQRSELDQGRNSWDDIDDFNWLASDKRSPNWSLIPENERVTVWDN
ncbi:tubulin-specific chaperone C-like [Amphiura filiformis]|uniref:tubulin-specific chaperone C-like n=1 Tax=Amphiura filiformis TaxID=82378 RepID=UPI003B223C5B